VFIRYEFSLGSNLLHPDTLFLQHIFRTPPAFDAVSMSLILVLMVSTFLVAICTIFAIASHGGISYD
jgi:hypothetical protein